MINMETGKLNIGVEERDELVASKAVVRRQY